MPRHSTSVLLLLALALSAQSAPAAPAGLLARLANSSFGSPGDRSFDYVVVGGGTAGLTIAARLAEDPSTSVAVVEAGAFYEDVRPDLSIPANDGYWIGKDANDTNPLVDWGFLTTPQAVSQGN